MKIKYISPVLFIVDIDPDSLFKKNIRYKLLMSTIAGKLKYAIQYAGKLRWYTIAEYIRMIFFSRTTININKKSIFIKCPSKFMSYKGERE